MRLVINLLACIALSGCVGATTPETARSQTNDDLCRVIHWGGNGFNYGADAALDELARRGAYSQRDLSAIAAGAPYVGMTESAALCSLGGFYDHINTTMTASGIHRQYVVGETGSGVHYLYTQGGVVTGVQS